MLHVLQFQTRVSHQVLVLTQLSFYIAETASQRSLHLNGCLVVSSYEIVFRVLNHAFAAERLEVVSAVESD